MSRFLTMQLVIYDVESDDWTLLSITTYLDMILLFMAYCDLDNTLARSTVVRCLALIDFLGTLLAQLNPSCNLSSLCHECPVMLVYEMCFLFFERLAYNMNTKLLTLSQSTSRDMIIGRNMLTKPSFAPIQTLFRVRLQKNMFYHGLTLLLSHLLMTILYPSAVQIRIPLVFYVVIKKTLFRGMFFVLDGVVIYAINLRACNEDKQSIVWEV